MWGAAPLLFLALGRAGADSLEIVAERAAWSAPFAFVLVLSAGQAGEVWRLLRDPKRLALLSISAAAIGAGWTAYVWAVNNGRNLEASLGYYINPLMNVAAGAVFFREKLTRVGWVAIGLAVVGVALQTIALGHLPLVALFLAATFWIYGLIRKQIKAEAQSGLFVECLLIMAPGIAYVAWLAHSGHGLLGQSTPLTLLTILVGPVTVAPLALFSWTARRLPLSTIGFLQFISPTIGFGLGIYLGESLTWLRLASFGFIWAGVVVFAWSAWRRANRSPLLSSDNGLA